MNSATIDLYQGDMLEEARRARDCALIYLDPPFFTQRTHRMLGTAEKAFEDSWESLDAYLEWLGARLSALKACLAPYGSIVVHVDSKTSHYVKVLGDDIFGYDRFASEIVWRYRRWPSKTPNFQRVHDVLLRWTSYGPSRWNQQYEPLASSTVKTWGNGKQVAVVDSTGRRMRSSTITEPSKGCPMGDVWDISIVAPVAKERTGYPTQKPEALLERLIMSLTDGGDLVLDPCCGSGTTIAVANRLCRRAVGIDINPKAILMTGSRCHE